VLQLLQDEKQLREAAEKELKNREDQHRADVETLKTQHELAVNQDGFVAFKKGDAQNFARTYRCM
jgi:hypothetical protein